MHDVPVSHEGEIRRRGCWFYFKRGLLGLVIVIVALPILGFVYETIMAAGDNDRYPPPGQLVDVGDYKLHLYCVGEGSPAVILTYGFADNSLTWSQVQAAIAEQGQTRVCAWDRAGLGWSEPSPHQGARTPSDVAAELHALLTAANIPDPYVMVGHSLGGLYTRRYVIDYPDDVSGLVLVDSSHETTSGDQAPKSADELAQEPPVNPLYTALVRLGVIRLFGRSLVTGLQPAAQYLPDDVLPQYVAVTGRMNAIQAWAKEEAGQTEDKTILSANTSLDDRPLAVLVSTMGIENNDRWEQAQQIMAGYSSNSRLEIVPDSDHMLQWQHPEAVTAAVVAVIASARTGDPLTQ